MDEEMEYSHRGICGISTDKTHRAIRISFARLTGGDMSQVRETTVAVPKPFVVSAVVGASLWMLGQRGW